MSVVKFPARAEMPPPDDVDFIPEPPPGLFDDEPEANDHRLERRAVSVADVLSSWTADGPLVHEPTGITRLDELTGGGPVYGSRWYLAGSPDAGKTALLVQLAHDFALRGIAVGLLAVDEEATDLVTRLAQRVGHSRWACELRDADSLGAIGADIANLPIRFYDESWTIESAAEDVARFAQQRAAADPDGHKKGPRAFLGIDSVQTVHCEADVFAKAAGRETSEVSAVTGRVRAIRAVASRHRLIAVATSELGRGAYRSGDVKQQTATLAAAKWSGAIEYSARVLIGLRSVAGETDLIDLELAKNKHGPRDEHVFLSIDRRSQTLSERSYHPKPAETDADRDSAAKGRVSTDAVAVARILRAQPGIGLRELRGAARAAAGIGHDRVDAAVAALGGAVVRATGARGARPMSLDLDQLSPAIRAELESE